MKGTRGAGFTLIEILVAMTLTLAVFAITLPFVRAQTRALGASAGRLDADQIARYAQRAVDRDLRLASAVEGQPLLVLAGPFAVSFNANLLAPDTTDPGAADIESGAATTLTESWAVANASTLPLVARSYPTQAYLDADGASSRSETISYFLRPDTITGRNDIYVLYRRVNARDSVQIVRGLYVPTDSAFFNYQRPISGTLTRIAGSRLPLYWDSAAVDSVRAVGIRAAGYFRDRFTGAVTLRTVNWTSVLPNAANRVGAGCRGTPAAPTAVTATKVTTSQPYGVNIAWSRSATDTAGSDVRSYLIESRTTSSAEPWVTTGVVSATASATYQWMHAQPTITGARDYAVRAVTCAAIRSTQGTASSVTLP